MSQFNQMQLSFDPLEDRLLFSISTQAQTEYRLWFTRRYVKLLWEFLLEQIRIDLKSNQEAQHASRDEVLSFEHEKATTGADFQSQYSSDNLTHPLGETPLLVSNITMKTDAEGTRLLRFHPESDEGVQISLNKGMLHLLCKLLADSVQKTDWDLSFQISTIPAASESVVN